ncbi:hypothetical protein BT63DRAFT_412246 [Microthyrium microscopicum]|uniref:DUF7730 domain-containing protein n=1 Tax=Microthyrium microscopicum TaxID=703497 RepID=A0A6A6UFY4_9PEZI|nr:hypothetical protein BT63DRAFT_412246 [Microthyrium microscopicum]
MSVHDGRGSFLRKLPMELRLMVYENLLVDPASPHIYYAVKISRNESRKRIYTNEAIYVSRNPRHAMTKVYVNILQTCKQIYGEAHPILYSSNTFELRCQHVNSSPSVWAAKSMDRIYPQPLSSVSTNLITRLEVVVDSFMSIAAAEMIVNLFPALRSLRPISRTLGSFHYPISRHQSDILREFTKFTHVTVACTIVFGFHDGSPSDLDLNAMKSRWLSEHVEYNDPENLQNQIDPVLGSLGYDAPVIPRCRYYIPHFGPHREIMQHIEQALKRRDCPEDVPMAWSFRTVTKFNALCFIAVDLKTNKRQDHIPCEIVGPFGATSRNEGIDEEAESLSQEQKDEELPRALRQLASITTYSSCGFVGH